MSTLQQQVNQLLQQSRFSDACVLLEDCCRNNDQDPGLWFALSDIKVRIRDWQGAGECLYKVLALAPDAVATYINLGCVQYEQGQYALAVENIRRGLVGHPLANGYYNLGKALRAMEAYADAIEAYEEAIKLNPSHAEAYVNMGHVYQRCGDLKKAVDCYQKALQLRPELAGALANLSSVYLKTGKVDAVFELLRGLFQGRKSTGLAGDNYLMAVNYTVNDPQEFFLAHRRWAEFEGLTALQKLAVEGGGKRDHDRTPDRRLRIGYVSPDFRTHAVAFFFENLLNNHNVEQVEVFCYSTLEKGDAVTQRLKHRADHWRDIFILKDEEVCRVIQEDGIDILVDLAGHTAGNRLAVFLQRPAPLQVTYLGYPGTTGLTAMDYRMTDIWADPRDDSDAVHSETLLRLPHAFFCFKPHEVVMDEGQVPSESTGKITFASFNALAKLTDATLKIWWRILQAVNGARLCIMAGGMDAELGRVHLSERMAALGFDMHRVELLGQCGFEEYLTYHRHVDIALDSLPWNGHTTTCHALWMGVPQVVLAGSRHASRMGVSIMKNMGLDELIANSPDDCVNKVIALANDAARLEEYRRTLRPRLLASPLCDGARFAGEVETVYRRIWQTWVEQDVGANEPRG